MVTYQDVQFAVRAVAGFVPKTCWIAHVLELHRVTLRVAPNRITPASRKNPCPPDKIPAISAALYKLGKIQSGPRAHFRGML